MGAGKVNWDSLYSDSLKQRKHIRWRRLQRKGKAPDNYEIEIFGYSTSKSPTGPWFGYSRAMLEHAPCHHCGRIQIFNTDHWDHICPGVWDGKLLPCEKPHACKGEPSMATAPMWRSSDWIERPWSPGETIG